MKVRGSNALMLIALLLASGDAVADTTTLNLPQKARLTFNAPMLNKQKEVQKDDRYQYVASSAGEADERFNLSVYVEPIDCKYGKSLQQVAHCFVEQLDSIPGVVKEPGAPNCERKRCDIHYVISAKAGDHTVTQLNLNTLFVYRGAWVDVHLSVLNPKDDEARTVGTFAASLKLAE